jgi:uncharacterized iron-regulated protein
MMTKLWAWSIVFLLLYALPARAQTIVTYSEETLQGIAKVSVVYLGETHDRPEDHQNQLEILQKLEQQYPKIAIAMEMFQRPYQDILNRYLAGEINEQELVEQSQYDRRWGFPWKYYAPILEFARAHHLPVLALNAPTEVTRQVARAGLESLTPQQRQLIPPFEEIRTDNVEYRQLLQSAFKQHHQFGHSSTINFERFFLTQVLWDETMADGSSRFLHDRQDYKVVVLAGLGHIIYGYGIPSRVARRSKEQHFQQRSILLSSPPSSAIDPGKPIADFVWRN